MYPQDARKTQAADMRRVKSTPVARRRGFDWIILPFRCDMKHSVQSMNKPLFTFKSVLSLLLCIGTGPYYLGTIKMSLYSPTPDLKFYTVPWLGWLCLFFGVLTFGLLSVREARLRREETRMQDGLCPRCGYDLRATPSRCPECGQFVKMKALPRPSGRGR